MTAAHHHVQRVVVRMLYDRPFAEAVYADPLAALTADWMPALPPEALAWLTANDLRAFTTDPLRRTRALAALLDEFPTAAAWVLTAADAGRATLDRYFSSPAFHRCIQQGEVLSYSFGAWLRSGLLVGAENRVLTALAHLETALARVRRATPPQPAAAPCWRTSPFVEPVRLPEGALAIYQHLREALAALGPDPMAQVIEGALRPLPVAQLGKGWEWLLVEGQPTAAEGLGPIPEVSLAIGGGAEGLNGLLSALQGDPKTDAEALAAALAAGAEADEAPGLLNDLAEEGLLLRQ